MANASTQPADEDFDGEFEDDIVIGSGGSSFPKMEDIRGSLLLVKPYDKGTRPGKRDGKPYPWVECDVVVLTEPEDGWPLREDAPRGSSPFFEGERAPFVLEGFQLTGQHITPPLLAILRNIEAAAISGGSVKTRYLAVLDKGQKSSGNSAPWIWEAANDEEKKLASAYARAQAAKAATENPWA
jgi:hypothetical protein